MSGAYWFVWGVAVGAVLIVAVNETDVDAWLECSTVPA